MKTRILFADGTLTSLRYFFNLLQPMRGLWDVSFVSSGAEALQLLEANPFDILISEKTSSAAQRSAAVTPAQAQKEPFWRRLWRMITGR